MSAAKPFIDPTTGLFTLDAWLDHAEREARRCGRYGHSMAIVVVGVRTPSGIVDLRRVNSRALRAASRNAIDPAILNAVAEAVSTSLREHDVVGDLGDGQLAIALPETGIAGARVVAERTAKLAASAVEKAGVGDTVATTGLAMCRPDDEGVARALAEVGMLAGLAAED